MSAAGGRYFAICDANNFYASAERVFAPELTHRPVVVLSNNDGCVIARSQEAKDLGIEMGTPYFQLRDRAYVKALSSNYTLYGDMSRRLMNVLGRHCHDLEVYSIDEAFMELRLHGQTPESLVTWATELRAEALRLTGLPTSIGIGRTKVLAKLASHAAKRIYRTDAHYLGPNDDLLGEIPVGKVWGAGRAYVRRLGEVGVTTAAGLRDIDEEWMRRQFGVVGQRLVRELRGESCLPLSAGPPPRANVMVSRSFPHDISDVGELERRMALFASRLGEKLRDAGRQTSHLTAYTWFNPHKLPPRDARGYSRSVQLPLATNHDSHLVAWSRAALRSQLLPGHAYKKIGVMATELIDAGATQTSLLASGEKHVRDRRAMDVIHDINRRYGRGTVYVAACGESPRELPLRRDRHSPRYTTRSSDLAPVYAATALRRGSA